MPWRSSRRSLAILQSSASRTITGTICDGLSRTGSPAAVSACLVVRAWRWCSSRSACDCFRWRTAACAAAATAGGNAVVKMKAGAYERTASTIALLGARTDGSLIKATLASSSPADILLQPIFNPVGGYASYIVPAAFVLILQQVLLIGAALLTVVTMAQRTGGAFATVLGRGIAHLTIYLPALALYFIVLPHVYGFSTLGDPVQLIALVSVFTLATSFMGQAAGAWFKYPETPTLIFLGTSLPQLFLTGFSWPREAIPDAAQAAGYIFPSDFAIDGIVRINQLGASLWEVARDWRALWIQAIVYFALAVISVLLVKR